MANKVLFETELTDVSTTDIEGVGTVREDRRGKRYRWVKNASAIASRAGGPACYDMGNGTETDLLDEVLVDMVDEDLNLFAGVFLAAIAASGFGWIQTWGRYATARYAVGTTTTAAAVGDILVPTTGTDTTVTAEGRAFSFILGSQVAAADSTIIVALSVRPHIMALEAIAINTDTAATATLASDVFIKGLI